MFGGSGEVGSFLVRLGGSDGNFNPGVCADNVSPDSGVLLFGNGEPAGAEFAALGNLERPRTNFPIDQFSGIPGSLIVCP